MLRAFFFLSLIFCVHTSFAKLKLGQFAVYEVREFINGVQTEFIKRTFVVTGVVVDDEEYIVKLTDEYPNGVKDETEGTISFGTYDDSENETQELLMNCETEYGGSLIKHRLKNKSTVEMCVRETKEGRGVSIQTGMAMVPFFLVVEKEWQINPGFEKNSSVQLIDFGDNYLSDDSSAATPLMGPRLDGSKEAQF